MKSDLLQNTEVSKQLFKRRIFDPLVTTQDGKRNERQKDALILLTDNTTKELAYGGAAGGAKSWTGCLWLAMMCSLYPNTKYFIGREELKRLRESTLITFYKVCRAYRITEWKYNGQDHFIIFDNGSRIDLLELQFKPSDPMYERFGSTEYTSGWVEEGGEVNFGAYDTLRSRINRQLNDEYGITAKILVTLNPKKNWVYEYFWKPYKENNMPEGIVFLRSFVNDNPFNQKGYVEQLNNITDKVKRARLKDGDFEYDDNPLAMMDYPKILELYTNAFVSGGDNYMTCDLAYEGSDIFVVMVWEGLKVTHIYARDKISEVAVPGWIQELRLTHKVPLGNVVYDADGVKRFVRQSANSGTLNGAKEFHNNGSPLDPGYFNQKSECYFKLAEYVNTNKIYIACSDYREQVIQELEQIRKIETADDGKLRVEKKDALRERLKRSSDFADCLMFRMLFELKKTSKPRVGLSHFTP